MKKTKIKATVTLVALAGISQIGLAQEKSIEQRKREVENLLKKKTQKGKPGQARNNSCELR